MEAPDKTHGGESEPEKPTSNPGQEPGSDGEGEDRGERTERSPEKPSSNPGQEPGSD